MFSLNWMLIVSKVISILIVVFTERRISYKMHKKISNSFSFFVRSHER